MQDFLVIFGLIANVITVVAGLVAIAGVLWAVLGRAKLTVSNFVSAGPSPSLTVTISSTGSNPVHDVELSVGALDDNGFALWGDGAGRRPALYRGESLAVSAYDDATTTHGSPPFAGEHRHAMRVGEGFFVNVQWRSPLFPWRRSSATYMWPPMLRFASRTPQRLTGRAESMFFARAHDPRNNPESPGFSPPKWAPPRATLATDETFDDLVLNHKGLVLVGFGASSQGPWWTNVQRMLHAFAANYAPRVKVVIVTTDDCPNVAQRYSINVFPHFKLFRNGTVVVSHDGAGSMLDVEAALSPHLK